jgi:2-polyprenyl-3-methyl-5-hydroxy-6-metoxy-1,4-benzoquinol methylase
MRPRPPRDTGYHDMPHDNAPDAPQAPCPICSAPSHYEYSGRDLLYDLHDRYDYHLCPTCGCVFQHPMPDMTTIAGFYPENYMVYDQDKRIRHIPAWRQGVLKIKRGYTHLHPGPLAMLAARFMSLIQTPKTPVWENGGRMLDIGCGNGRFMTSMRTLGWAVQGVEFSETGVKAARMSELEVHHGDLRSANFLDSHFDLVTARHVIEHIPDPQDFLAEVTRVLRPGGRLVIETPSSAALGRQWFNTHWYANDVPRHLILFSPENLERLGTQHGLRRIDLIMETTPKIFLNSLDYILGNRDRPSKRIAWRRLLARLYVRLAERKKRGDVMQMTFQKLAKSTSPTP